MSCVEDEPSAWSLGFVSEGVDVGCGVHSPTSGVLRMRIPRSPCVGAGVLGIAVSGHIIHGVWRPGNMCLA